MSKVSFAALLDDAVIAGMTESVMLQFADEGPKATEVLEFLIDNPDLMTQLNEANIAIRRYTREALEKMMSQYDESAWRVFGEDMDE